MTGSLSGEQVGSAYCPPGDYCPLVPEPQTLWLPADVLISLNWTAINGSTVNVGLYSVSDDSGVGSCYWEAETSGFCKFWSDDSPNPAAYDLSVGAVRLSNSSLPEIAYTFTW